ncbi:MAG: hypothetical protein ACR2P3_02705, partial [Geminicoccaceae bacterium]
MSSQEPGTHGQHNAHDGENCDVTAANPSFDPEPYEEPPDPVPAPTGEARAADPSPSANRTEAPKRQAAPKAPTADPPRERQQGDSARATSFTAREMQKLVEDDDFRADLDAILNGAEAAPQPRVATSSKPAPHRKQEAPPPPPPRTPSQEDAAAALSETPGEHAIFDKIAQNMRYAKAYELAPVSLNRRFDSFDRQRPKRPPGTRSASRTQPASHSLDTQSLAAAEQAPAAAAPSRAAVTPSDSAGGADRMHVHPETSPAVPTEESPNPSMLRPYSEAERIATFGDPHSDPK